ncbi:hypothetical protein C3L33_17403, partial [Rhododendron williamsianum]
MKGHETKNHALACFGGAGPQHACAIARSLGMKEVLIHRFCGILSAYGMGLADVIEEAQEPYSAVYDFESLLEAAQREAILLKLVKQKLLEQGFREENVTIETFLNLRYEGTDTAIMVRGNKKEDGSGGDYAAEFVKLFQQEYGFKLENRNIVICDVRVRGIGVTNILKPRGLEPASGGEGLVREIEFRRPVVVSILSERRVHAPRGLKGGKDGARGVNYLITKDKRRVYVGGIPIVKYMRYVDKDVSEMNTIDSDVAIIQFLPPPHGALRPSNIIHSRGGVGGRPGRR